MRSATEKLKLKKTSKIVIFIIAIILILVLGAIITSKDKMTRVKLETTQGEIILNLYSDMPITSGNFEKLVKEGFYDGVIFHRVIDGFMIQGGDPTGTGMGGPGYKIQDEFTHQGGNRNDRGTISMANAGPNTGGSQFFINLVDNNFLDSKHPAFGKVIEGMDVVDKIAKLPTNHEDRPLEEIKIIKATILK
jgi:peptidylprolyl isomerase